MESSNPLDCNIRIHESNPTSTQSMRQGPQAQGLASWPSLSSVAASAQSACGGSEPQSMDVIGSSNQQTMEGRSSGHPISVDHTIGATNDGFETEEPGDDGKRKLTSKVWESYKREKIDGAFKAICNFCKKRLGGETKNGTKHLHDHLKRCPKRRQMDTKQMLINQQPKDDGKFKMTNYMFQQETSRKELAKMIVLHELPLSFVEYEGFYSFCRSLQPMFSAVSRRTIKRDIMAIYDFEKSKTMKLLKNNSSRVAITTDMWTSSNQKKGFMVITAHFIDDSWTLQARVLRFVYVPSPHTTEALTAVLARCLLTWSIDRKISTVTLDNCSANDAMVDSLLLKLHIDSLMLDGSFFHMRCAAHILNLIVKDGLDVISIAVERIRESIVYWTASPKREQKFEEAVKQLRIPHTKKLCLDCKTRWNSTYLMLSCALLYKDVFPRLKLLDSMYKSVPSEENWEMARRICEKLQVFYEVTELFSGTEYPTANLLFPHICEIKLKISEWLTDLHAIIRDMASRMLGKYNKYWSVVHGIVAVAVVLDPRYKLRLLNFYFKQIYADDEALFEIQKVKQYFYDLLRQYKSRNEEQIGKSSDTATSSLDASSGSGSGVCRLPARMKDFYLELRMDPNSENLHSEFDHYLDEANLPVPIVEDFDILSWWKLNGCKFPTLQRIAKDVLAVPVSMVASESAFSTSGRVVTPHRNRLHPNTLEALMCTQNWLWAERRDMENRCPTVDEEESENDSGVNEQDETIEDVDFED